MFRNGPTKEQIVEVFKNIHAGYLYIYIYMLVYTINCDTSQPTRKIM